jgi:hypothetical protein
VQQWDHDVDIERVARCERRHRHRFTRDIERGRQRVARAGLEHALRVRGSQPVAVGRDADGQYVVLLGIERTGDGHGGDA